MRRVLHLNSLSSSEAQTGLRITRILMGALLMGLAAPLAIHLPWTPVPIVLQCHLCLGLASIMGRSAAWSMILFLLQGAAGAPVFAGCTGGLDKLLGPSGGYLFGYVVAAYVVGWAFEKYSLPTATQRIMACGLGSLVIYGCGVLHLQHWTGWAGAIAQGILPFLLGDVVKLLGLEQIRSWLVRRVPSLGRPS